MTLEEIYSELIPTGECLISLRGKTGEGYPVITFEGKQYLLSRVIMHLANGMPLDSELLVMHSCDNRACGRLEHLSSGTHRNNSQDASCKGRLKNNFKNRIGKSKGYFKCGHPYELENIYRSSGRVVCKECRRLRYHKNKAKKEAQN